MAGTGFSLQTDPVTALCQDLLTCVSRIYDPACSQEERRRCNQTIAEFKENNSSCIECGFQLAQDQNPVARHFGLQLIEEFVKYRWQDFKSVEKQQVYLQELIKYLKESVSPNEPVFVKEAVARVTVETAKQMWPQNWGSFMQDMAELSIIGPVQVELVLVIFRRLAEDIHLYESGLDQRRKKEMATALNEQINQVVEFILQNLEMRKADSEQSANHLKAVALDTISSFACWVEFKVILMNNCKLLTLLYNFLQDDNLKTPSCECLLHIISRKGDVKRTAEQRQKLLILLSKDAIESFFKASIQANPLESGIVLEQNYVFLKRICQVLVQLGVSQLAPLWLNAAKDEFIDTVPVDFQFYLDVILEFTKHDSQLLSMTSCDVWATFINHNYIKENKCFKSFMPRILTECREKFTKVGDPSQSNHISAAFSRVDFDSEEEYIRFYSNFRTKISRIVGHLCLANPRTAAKEAMVVVKNLVQSTTTSDGRSSMEYMKWEAFASYLDCWTNTFKSEPHNKDIEEVKDDGIAVLKHLVAFNTSSTLLLQCQFRCMQSGLLVFLHLDTQLFENYIQKVFKSVGFMGGNTDKYDLPKDVVTARNSIITCFTHLCDNQSKVLAPHINYLGTVYEDLIKRDELVYAEKCSFMEALLILSLQAHSLEAQSTFIKELLQEVHTLFTEMKSSVSSVEAFIQYFGLDKDPSDATYQPRRRLGLCHVVNTVNHILRRSKAVCEIPYITEPRQHPTYFHVLPLVIDFCIPLIRIMYQLWSGEYKPMLAPHFQELEQFHPFERDNVLGKTMMRRSEDVSQSEVRRLQMNLAAVHEASLAGVARALSVYGYQYMCDVKVVECAMNAVFSGVIHLNHWRLRVVLRHLIHSLVVNCPIENWDDVLIPFIHQICRLVFSRLKESWGTIQQRQAALLPNGNTSCDGMKEKEEIFHEQLTIALSREYSDLLEMLCVMKIAKKPQDGDVDMGDGEEDEERTMEQWSLYCSLSPLAERLLAINEIYEVLFYSSFCGITWRDTHTANKCTCVAGLIYVKALKDDPPPIVLDLFQLVLSGLNIHGIHDHVRSQLSFLALIIYQSAFSKFGGISAILAKLSQVELSKIQAFNSLLSKHPPPSVKTKKDKFKDILKNIIGKHVSEVYKHKLTFDLPEMEFRRKAKEDTDDIPNLAHLFESTN